MVTQFAGGIRHDYSEKMGLTRLEDRTLNWPVSGLSPLLELPVGYTARFFITRALESADGLEDLEDVDNDDVLVRKTATPVPSTLELEVAITPDLDDWPPSAGLYWYELWRTDIGNRRRIAYGKYTVIS